jgi:hypothetical protein
MHPYYISLCRQNQEALRHMSSEILKHIRSEKVVQETDTLSQNETESFPAIKLDISL